MAKQIVLCDMDGILADMTGKLIERVNNEHDLELKRTDFTHRDFEKCLPSHVKPWEYINEDGWFDDLKPLPGAIAGLAQIHDAGPMVVIATAPTRNPSCAAEKKRWLTKHATFLKPRNTMIGALKHLLKGDFLIDDSPEQQKNYREAWPDSTILTIEYSFAADKGVDVVAPDHENTSKAWDVIVKEVLARL